MEKNDLLKTVLEVANECAEKLNYEIVDVEYQVGSKHDLLSIFIYKKSGIDVDDCTDMSRSIEEKLDELNLIDKPYYLEISSPGLDRPLKNQNDYRRNVGNEVEVKLFAPLNDVKRYEGVLSDYNSDSIFLLIDENTVEIPIKSISIMRQLIKF
ncbi:ribosome maturation factor RimP [Anaerosphaera aminiphila DSM 21120]|uniref:Ribosome maturation factor RimP n=1 Tax=Anaerosphaera aminiphila DSM 21120 TaxID=1120995 RepID=A0A1M5NZN1_9FIRM|nr:ribosome maturation factor RimP [Anaerosphaera aminiphila]SHG94948.1 ribosome maturation factor RimP [Anaerosphaera aminiphila DSM 21120]